VPVVEFKNHVIGYQNNVPQIQKPFWIVSTGEYPDPDDGTHVGWAINNSPYYYTPDTLVSLTKQELVARVLDINTRYPMSEVDEDGNPTDQGIQNLTAEVEEWYDNTVAQFKDVTL